MSKILIGEKDYKDKVYACWLGKNIGGTLGAPYECRKYVNCLEFYGQNVEEAAPNDDLDLQLVWLKMLEDRGIDAALPDFAEYWIRYLSAYPWNEYGFCRRNLERGLRPPISGCFENYYIDEMGSPIRSEIWACVAPGDPELAASLAWNDSALDHAGGEGTCGEMFWAALESAAFVIDDPQTLIDIGLAMIPVHSIISRAVREAVWCHDNGLSWAEARERIVTSFGHHQPCHAPQNHGFTILGWLYGKDYGDQLCKAVNCGYDTDCTGATLGSVLGIVHGTSGIPERWRKPVGDAIVLHKFTGDFNSPKTIQELTDRTFPIATQMVAAKSDTVQFADQTERPDDVVSILMRNDRAQKALRQDVLAAVAVDGDTQVVLHYGGAPVMKPGIAKTVGVTLRQDGALVQGEVELQAPGGWQVSPTDSIFHQTRFVLCADTVPGHNEIKVKATLADGEPRTASFVILGPDQALGFPCGQNVPKCGTCGARQEACICNQGSA